MRSKRPTARSTIKNDPFATVIPLPVEVAAPAAGLPPAAPDPALPAPQVVNDDRPRPSKLVPEPKPGKQKLTVHLGADLAERVKNTAYWNPG